MCIGIDLYNNVLVWGTSNEGTLGLGYRTTSIETPTKLESLKQIVDVSLSDSHAVAISSIGEAFSWGTGKYGELGLSQSIYTPTPLPMSSDKTYTKVFCGNLITCLLDNEGHFSYYGVIIKSLKGVNSSITVKSLLNDQSVVDNNVMFMEKVISEIENESFESIVIANGFIGLLSMKGNVFVLEYSDKLTRLYNKHFIYSIAVAHNDLFGLGKEKDYNVGLKRSESYIMQSSQNVNHYLYQWNSVYNNDKDVSSEIWHTLIYKVTVDMQMNNNNNNLVLLNSNGNKSLILLLDKDVNASTFNLNNSYYTPNTKHNLRKSESYDISSFTNTNNISSSSTLINDFPINMFNKGNNAIENFLIFDSEYDDSYNLNFKQSKTLLYPLHEHSNNNNNNNSAALSRSKSFSPYQIKNISYTYTNDKQYGNSNNNYHKSNTNIIGKKFTLSKSTKTIEQNGDDVNYYDESIDMKEKQLNNVDKEFNEIASNYKLSQKTSLNNSLSNYNSNIPSSMIMSANNSNSRMFYKENMINSTNNNNKALPSYLQHMPSNNSINPLAKSTANAESVYNFNQHSNEMNLSFSSNNNKHQQQHFPQFKNNASSFTPYIELHNDERNNTPFNKQQRYNNKRYGSSSNVLLCSVPKHKAISVNKGEVVIDVVDDDGGIRMNSEQDVMNRKCFDDVEWKDVDKVNRSYDDKDVVYVKESNLGGLLSGKGCNRNDDFNNNRYQRNKKGVKNRLMFSNGRNGYNNNNNNSRNIIGNSNNDIFQFNRNKNNEMYSIDEQIIPPNENLHYYYGQHNNIIKGINMNSRNNNNNSNDKQIQQNTQQYQSSPTFRQSLPRYTNDTNEQIISPLSTFNNNNNNNPSSHNLNHNTISSNNNYEHLYSYDNPYNPYYTIQHNPLLHHKKSRTIPQNDFNPLYPHNSSNYNTIPFYHNTFSYNNNQDRYYPFTHISTYFHNTTTKTRLSFFVYVLNNYLKRKTCSEIIMTILKYQIYKEKRYACKMIYRLILKKMFFYKIKFFRRIYKLYKFLMKYKS